jgi:hypothetical protein
VASLARTVCVNGFLTSITKVIISANKAMNV